MNFLRAKNPFATPMSSDPRAVRRRANMVGGLLLAGLIGLGAKAYQIAVVNHDAYAEQGNRQQLRNYTLDASRGDVVDRAHVALAVNDRVFDVVLNPRLIRSVDAGERVLVALTEVAPELDPDTVRKELLRDKAYRRLKLALADDQASVLRSRRLPGVRLEPSPDRVYPRKHLAAHVLGRVNGQGKGNLGVEYSLDEYLRGRDATSPAFFARGVKLLTEGHPDPGISRGHTVVLTLDSAAQAIVEEEIDTLVANWKPVGASVVVLDPRTGEVLAVTNRPTFDPNHRVGRLQQTVNLAVQSAYEPGSTIKAITVAAALEQGVVRRDERFFCEEGRWQYTPEHAIKDTKISEWLSVTEILAVSSNICTTKIYERLGKRSLFQWVKRFHFGERPDIKLQAATGGLLAHYEKWSDIQAANISFGQGMSASPLQVAAAFAALANGGVYNPPSIVNEIVDAQGASVYRHEAAPERVVRPATAETVMTMLESVVHTKKGTGKNARINGYRVAGKTSTAQKASKRGGYEEDLYYASFVGAVPARDPRVVILVSVDAPEGGHYGNEVAAPTFARVGARLMEYMGVPRVDGTEPAVDPVKLAATDARIVEGFIPDLDREPDLPGQRRVPFTTGLPDFTGLSLARAYDAAEEARVDLRAVGTGIAIMQDVPPGPVDGDSTVTVFFEPPA